MKKKKQQHGERALTLKSEKDGEGLCHSNCGSRGKALELSLSFIHLPSRVCVKVKDVIHILCKYITYVHIVRIMSHIISMRIYLYIIYVCIILVYAWSNLMYIFLENSESLNYVYLGVIIFERRWLSQSRP